MLSILFIIVMAVLARMAGGGFGATWLDKYSAKFVPALLFSLPFGFMSAYFAPPFPIIAFMIGALISYLGMQAATGPALHWGKNPTVVSEPRKITPLVNYLANKFGFSIGSKNYCRLWMAVKGFIIGLPVGALPLMILWPLAYEIGNDFKPIIGNEKGQVLAEVLSGTFAAFSILLLWH